MSQPTEAEVRAALEQLTFGHVGCSPATCPNARAREVLGRLIAERVRIVDDGAEKLADILGCSLADAAAALAQRDEAMQNRELRQLRDLAYVPGSWECPVCGYVEVKSILYVASGTIGANPEPALPCPNDGATMRPSTWKGHAEAMDKHAARVEAERLVLAKLAHPKPQFFNPIDVVEAAKLRDRILAEGAS